MKGLYYATSLLRMLLNNGPRLLWGEHPQTATEKMLSWSAPLASNMMGMYINSQMRTNTIETNKNDIKKLEATVRDLQRQIEQQARHQSR